MLVGAVGVVWRKRSQVPLPPPPGRVPTYDHTALRLVKKDARKIRYEPLLRY